MAKNLTAAAVAAKWNTNASAAGTAYAAGIAAVTENPMAKAAQAVQTWQQAVNDPATAAKFVRKLNAADFNAWKAQAAAPGARRYVQGVSDKQAKYEAAIAPVLAYIQGGLPAIQNMPKGTLAARQQRMNAWFTYMSNYKGQA